MRYHVAVPTPTPFADGTEHFAVPVSGGVDLHDGGVGAVAAGRQPHRPAAGRGGRHGRVAEQAARRPKSDSSGKTCNGGSSSSSARASKRRRNWPTPGSNWATSKTTAAAARAIGQYDKTAIQQLDNAGKRRSPAEGPVAGRAANKSAAQIGIGPATACRGAKAAAGRNRSLRHRSLRRAKPDASPADLHRVPCRRGRVAAGRNCVHGVRFRRAVGPGNPLAAALRAAREYLLAQQRLRPANWRALSDAAGPPGGHQRLLCGPDGDGVLGRRFRLRIDRRRLETGLSAARSAAGRDRSTSDRFGTDQPGPVDRGGAPSV